MDATEWLEQDEDGEVPAAVQREIIRGLRQQWQAEKITARYAYKTARAIEDEGMKAAAVQRAERAIKALEVLGELEAELPKQ